MKKLTITLIAIISTLFVFANSIKPINEFKLKTKYSILLNVEIELIQNLVLYEFINNWLNVKYKFGGVTKNGIDCSAFVQKFYPILPRTSFQQFNYIKKINREELTEGDLVFFKTKGKKVNHVGIYLQNNKFIHASVSNGVIISDLNNKYYKSKFYKAGRI